MSCQQRPQVGIVGVGSFAAVGWIAPHCVGDQIGEQPVELFVSPSMQPDETRPAQHIRVLVEQIP